MNNNIEMEIENKKKEIEQYQKVMYENGMTNEEQHMDERYNTLINELNSLENKSKESQTQLSNEETGRDFEKEIADKRKEIEEYQKEMEERGISYTEWYMDDKYNILVNELRDLQSQSRELSNNIQQSSRDFEKEIADKRKEIDEYQKEMEEKGLSYTEQYLDEKYNRLVNELRDLQKQSKEVSNNNIQQSGRDFEKEIADKKKEIEEYQKEMYEKGMSNEEQYIDEKYNNLVGELNSLERERDAVQKKDVSNETKVSDEKDLDTIEEKESELKEKKSEQEGREDQKEKVDQPKDFIHFMTTKVLKDTELKVSDDRKYVASNIKVKQAIKNVLDKGNRLHKAIMIPSAAIQIPATLVMKLYGKIMYNAKTKERVEKLKENLENLVQEDLEYLAKNAHSENLGKLKTLPPIIQTLLNERMQKYYKKKTEPVQEQTSKVYVDVFQTKIHLDEINNKLSNSDLSIEDREKLEKDKAELLKNSCDMIKKIHKNNEVVSKIINSTGAHAFEENTRAMKTKNNLTGTSIAKRHNYEGEVKEAYEKLGMLGKNLDEALELGDNEKALNAFIEQQLFMSDNTEIRNGILGERSVGIFEYNPIVEKLDYRDNTLVKDALRAAALVGTAVNIINSIDVSRTVEAMRVEHNAGHLDNQEAYVQLQESVEKMKASGEDIQQGMETQAYINSAAKSEIAHSTSDRINDFHVGTSHYHATDSQVHDMYINSFNELNNNFGSLKNDLANGNISFSEYLQQVSEIASKSSTELNDVINKALPEIQKYAESHPTIDMSGSISTLTEIANNPDALSKMFEGINDINKQVEILSNLNLSYTEELAKLPDTVRSAIISGVITTAALQASSGMLKNNYEKGKYNEEVKEMVKEYSNNKNIELEVKEEVVKEEQTNINEGQPEKKNKRNKIIEMLKSLRNGIDTKKTDKMIDESEKNLADEVNEIMKEEGKGRSSR